VETVYTSVIQYVKFVAQTAPYGSWRSPITSELISTKVTAVRELAVDGRTAYWTEWRPSEGGRYVLMKGAPGVEPTDAVAGNYNIRSAVHEYGGGAFTVAAGTIYFSNLNDGRIYVQDSGGLVRPLTGEGMKRYADFTFDAQRHRLICVCEDHTVDDRNPVNSLISVDVKTGEESELSSGYDFYSSPRLSPDGSKAAWLAWSHPNMPWDSTSLMVAKVKADGSFEDVKVVAGGNGISIFQPEWSGDGTLYYVSDRSGWWNICRLTQAGEENLLPMEAEFGVPQWLFGLSTYAFVSDDSLICTYTKDGVWYLGILDINNRSLSSVQTPYNYFSHVKAVRNFATFIAASFTEIPSVVQYSVLGKLLELVYRPKNPAVDLGYLSVPKPIEFGSSQGWQGHAFLYEAHNKDFVGPSGQKPPLIVISHGGPTSMAAPIMNLAIQFWTSRGYSVVDVNYGGSTGFGRRYRERLNGQWGVIDVDDCIRCAKTVVKAGKADGDRLIIRGASAGGFTTLCALTFHNDFKAGASYYGVGDLEGLARDTHKFESKYLERLIGRYPESQKLYRERSPLHHANKISCPVIFFQGQEDRVVPPEQAEAMVAALKANGIPVSYLSFEAERHGFVRSETIKRCYEAELFFYSVVLKIPLEEHVEPISVENMKR